MDQVHDLMCRKQNSIHLVEPSLYAHQEDTPWCLYYLGVSINPRMYKQIHIPTMVQGGGGEGGWNPSLEFSICCSILKRFYL